MKPGKIHLVATALALAILAGIGWYHWLNPNPLPDEDPSSMASSGEPLPRTEPWQENAARGFLWDLHNACNSLWSTEGEKVPCTLDALAEPPYRFTIPTADHVADGPLEYELLSGKYNSFKARASHGASSVWWEIDSKGRVSCSPGNPGDCERMTHSGQGEVLKEVREFAGDIPVGTRAIEITGQGSLTAETGD